MVTSVNGSTAATQTQPTQSLGATAIKDASEMQDRFLKLLVAQLSNQDPMNPTDNAQITSQMAQINTVSGIQKMQQSIDQLSAQMSAGQTLQGMQMIGREIMRDGNQVYTDANGQLRGGFELSAAADQVSVEFLSAGGQVLGSQSLVGQKAGVGSFSAKASDFPQATQFRIKASTGGQPVTATTQSMDRVSAVATSAQNGLQIRLASGADIGLSAVKSIL